VPPQADSLGRSTPRPSTTDARRAPVADGSVRRYELAPPHTRPRRDSETCSKWLRISQQSRAVQCVPVYDHLALTFELLDQGDWAEFDEPEPLPPNVVRFRSRTRR
jgi:hypothetical protein